jgi:DNA-binding NarL/FixJ family response regulator
MAPRAKIRLVVADDHHLFRQGLKALFKQEPEVTIVAEVERVGDLRAVLAKTACDQLLLDLQMDRNSLPEIASLAKRVPVVVLTASEVPADALAAIRMGARAVVFKRFAVETLMDAIRTVARGDVWMPASLQSQIATRLQNRPCDLSPREEQVVRYVALGLRNAEVAKKLSISEQTVKTHLNVVFRKLRVRDRVELTLYAARAGIINLRERPG